MIAAVCVAKVRVPRPTLMVVVMAAVVMVVVKARGNVGQRAIGICDRVGDARGRGGGDGRQSRDGREGGAAAQLQLVHTSREKHEVYLL